MAMELQQFRWLRVGTASRYLVGGQLPPGSIGQLAQTPSSNTRISWAARSVNMGCGGVQAACSNWK